MSKPYCVIGATRGTGLQIARQLIDRGHPVRVVVRDVAKARALLGNTVDVLQGDVTLGNTLRQASLDECHAIFYAVDITGGIAGRGMFKPAEEIRAVTFGGLVNCVDAARAAHFEGRFVLLSGMGSELPSTTGRFLNFVKGNLQKNQRDRDEHLRSSGLDYCIGRGGILTDEAGGRHDLCITPPTHSLSVLCRLSRTDFARALIVAADHPMAAGKTFDVFNQAGMRPDDEALDSRFRALEPGGR